MFEDYDCDYCDGSVVFRKVYDADGVRWWLECISGGGSDYLAIWCNNCGPKHRDREAVAIA